MGMEKWQKTDIWPPSGHTMQRWHLSENNGLSLSKPKTNTGEDRYQVDFEMSSGKGNRWHTHFRQKMYYTKREKTDEKLLTYTSPSLDTDIEITGHPIITLNLTSTHEDGMIIAYLEDIDENGNATYITEGLLRFIRNTPL